MPEISIIVPCYNVRKKIDRCLESLLKQTYKNFEVIFVNDNSSDDTSLFLESFKSDKSDFPVKIVNNEMNMGPSLSRKKGIEVSNGELLCFVDADDWLEDNYLFELRNSLLVNNSDLAFCDFNIVDSKGNKTQKTVENRELISDSKERILCNIDSCCLFVVKKSLIEKVNFPNIRNGEDMAILPQMFLLAKTMSYVNKPLYNYQYHSDSLSNKKAESVIESLEKSFETICDSIDVNVYYDEIEYIGIKNLIYGGLLATFRISNNRGAANILLSKFEERFPRWQKNQYMKNLPMYKRIFVSAAGHRAFLILRLLSVVHDILVR